jgi:hypothetical protein
MNDAVIAAVNAAKASEFGVTAIKVELEATLGRRGDFSSESYCKQWILERLVQYGLAEGEDGDYEVTRPLRYARFYNDGSVDSEFTFTLMLDNAENILLLPRVIEVFNELAEANGYNFGDGSNMDVRGAGMHTAFINERDGTYPTSNYMDQHFNNFAKSMSLLMPALYFLGTASERSRGLSYRRPGVGIDTHRSAIDYRGGALEFRLFDTCYETPEAILDNVCVMSNAIQFWTAKFKSSGVEKITTSTRWGIDQGQELKRFYITSQHLDLLNEGLKLLKPSYRTIAELKKARKFTLTKAQTKDPAKRIEKEATIEYEEYEERFTFQINNAMEQWARYLMQQGRSPSQARSEAERALRLRASSKRSLPDYIKEKIAAFEQRNVGSYTLQA